MPSMDGNQEQTARVDRTAHEQDFPASRSFGATINEEMMMPEETLAIMELTYEASDWDGSSGQIDTEAYTNHENLDPQKGRMETVRKYLAKLYKGIQARPLTFVLAAAGIGFICGRQLGAASRPQDVPFQR